MNGLPDRLYRADAVRALEARVLQGAGMAGGELMARAGAAAFAALRGRWPAARRLVVICGAGNNGGDGYVVARLAREAGYDVRVLAMAAPGSLPADAAAAARDYREAGGHVQPFDGSVPANADVIVDALFGIGLSRPVAGDCAAVIAAVNDAHRPVLALDVPSGLNADTGAILGDAVRAELTMTFLALKPGLFTGAGPACAGHVALGDLGAGPGTDDDPEPAARLCRHGQRPFPLSRRSRDAHKGNFGHVLVVGGDVGYAGAPRLAGEAAARIGAGLVTLATRTQHAGLQAAMRPELMAVGVENPAQLEPLLQRASVIAIGPGLGQADWGAALFARVLESTLPLVVDADALNLLARDPVQCDRWVLTPHPGEAARLLGATTTEVQGDRLAATRRLRDRFGGTVVLKGSGTVIAFAHGGLAICADGNPGMASGGMGDVLTGIIAGLLAQGLDRDLAAETGACLHGAAGDAAAREGERGLIAGDLMPWLRRLANPPV